MGDNFKTYYSGNPYVESLENYGQLFFGKFNKYEAVNIIINNFSLDPNYYIEEILNQNPKKEYISFYPSIKSIIVDFLEKCLMYGYYLYVFDRYHISSFIIECDARISINIEHNLFIDISLKVNTENKVEIFARYTHYRTYNSSSSLEIHTKSPLPLKILSLCNIRYLSYAICRIHAGRQCNIYESIDKIFKSIPYDDLPLYINVPFVSEYVREMLDKEPIERPLYINNLKIY